MENVTLSKDQKLITITEDKWKEYEDNTRKANENTITIRSSHYSYGMGYGSTSVSHTEHKTIFSAISEVQNIIKENQDILNDIRKTKIENEEDFKSVQENREKLAEAYDKLVLKKKEYEKDIQKVPKFIRKLFKVNI